MKYFVQFLHIRNGELCENIGSDGVFILDGRNTLDTMKRDAQERLFRLKNVSRIDGYRIMKGERFTNAEQVYQWVRSGARRG